MNVGAHQEKKKNEETKTGMKKVGKGRRQVANFREAVCRLFAVVQGAARQKNGSRGVSGVTGTLEKLLLLATETNKVFKNKFYLFIL